MGDDGPHASVPQVRTWQHAEIRSSSGARSSSKRFTILTLLAVMAGLAGIIIGLLLWIVPLSPPFFLSIPVSEYGPHFPPIPFAEQDSSALLQHFGTRREAFESQEGARRLAEELRQVAARTDDAVVVHLCAYGLCRNSDVYILPAKADPDSPGSELSVRQVLSLFGECRARHKLLILDIMRPLADPRLGILTNPVAERTHAILKELEDNHQLPFFVLCPCSRGQVALVSEELAKSVFGYYLSAGLDGQADGWNDGKRDRRVSVQELTAFVTHQVDHWAQHNRRCRQTPVLFGKAKDFPLIAATNPTSVATADEVAALASPAWLVNGWETRDQWWKDKVYRLAPRCFRQLEGTLLRAEERRRAGFEAARIRSDLDVAVQALKKQLEQAQKLSAVKLRLPSLAAPTLQPDAAIDKALRDLLVQLDTSPPVEAKSIQEAKKKVLEAFKEKPAQLIAWAVFSVAAEDLRPTPDKMRLFLDLLASVPGMQASSFEELRFLQKLGALKPDDEGKWPTDAAHHALQVLRERGKALSALAADPGVLPWVRQALQATAQKRREGEKLLFASNAEATAQAESVLENSERDYSTIMSAIPIIVKAQGTYEEALATLPGLVPYLANRPERDPQDESSWQEAVRSAQKLSELFDRCVREPVASLEDLRTETAELLTRTEALRRSLQALERSFRTERLRELKARSENGSPRDYLEMQALLESPRLPAKERKELAEAGRRLGQRLLEKSMAHDSQESAKVPSVNPANLLPVSSEDDHARWRARLALGLLKLGGVVGAEELDRSLDRQPHWQGWGDKLRELQVRQLPQQFDHLKPQELSQAVRLSYVLHPFDRYPGENSSDLSHPAARLLQQNSRDFQKWLDGFQP